MNILDHPVIASRYFFPRAQPPRPGHRVDVEVQGALLACARYDVGADVTLVHFHGNGEVVADWEDAFAEIAERAGVNLFLAEYRGYGGSTGQPALKTMLDDVDAVASAASADGSQLVAFGRSVGSIYAIELVHRHPETVGLILESGIADVLQRIMLRATPEELGATREEIEAAFAARLDHQAKLAAYEGPVLLLHAQNDHLVGVQHAHDNAAWAAGSVEKIIFERGDHNSIFPLNRDAYTEAVSQFLATLPGR